MAENEFTQNIDGDDNNVIQGTNPTQINNNSGEKEDSSGILAILKELQDQVGENDWPEETEPYVSEQFETPKLMLQASIDQIDQEVAEENFEQESKTWYTRMTSLIPLGVKLTSTFSAAALTKLVSKSPILEGLKAVAVELSNISKSS